MADFSVEQGQGGAATLALTGPMRVANLGDIDRRLATLTGPIARVDLSQVTDIDTAGAWLAHRLARDHQAEIAGASDKAGRLIAAVSRTSEAEAVLSERPPLVSRVSAYLGATIEGFGRGIYQVLGFYGAMLSAFGGVIRHPGRFRMKALVHQMELVGVTALGIIGLINFLVGITIAQIGAVQLREFGAEGLTVNLVGRVAMRELGILITAIMVAGRSGSAFAAQIGTMRLTEEVDAMRTIGVSPMEALVIPRVLATMLMMPLIGFFGSVCAMMGGAFISTLQLDMPFFTFLRRLQEVVPLHDFYVGMIKAPVFGLIIGVAGCHNGMQVKSNSEEVGLRTTLSVVAALFAVIVLDAFFAVFFSEVGWG